jgi:ATP-dependent Lhr-like helicase
MVKRGARGRIGRGGATLGKVEEYFFEQLSPGDTFIFSGKVLRFEGIRENECAGQPGLFNDPKIPSYAGGKFPLSTYLADQVRSMLADPEPLGDGCPIRCATGCRSRKKSRCCRSATSC